MMEQAPATAQLQLHSNIAVCTILEAFTDSPLLEAGEGGIRCQQSKRSNLERRSARLFA